MPVRYVALGDSFTEGVGDELPDGSVRGWADLVAQGWSSALGEPVEYANLAIRGRRVGAILSEQLDEALALRPTHLSFNGGGNDMLRPRANVDLIADAYREVLHRCADQGVRLIVLSGARPRAGLPLHGRLLELGEALCEGVSARLEGHEDVVFADNFRDREISAARYWSDDRLHLNDRGHHRVAARVLDQLGVGVERSWWDLSGDHVEGVGGWPYYREHVVPWLQRRLTGRSSGDGRSAKYAAWVTVSPPRHSPSGTSAREVPQG